MFKLFAALWISLVPFGAVQMKEPAVVTDITECKHNHLLLGQTNHHMIMLCPENIRSSNTDIETVVNHEIIHVIHYNLGLRNDETMIPKEYFDFIYVDGDHDEKAVIKDTIGSFRVLKKGGIIAFDDYLLGIRYPNSPGSKAMNGSTKKAIDYFLDVFQDELEIIHKDYQMWIRKK